MGVFKIKPGDLMRGANIDWPSVIAHQQVADMRRVNPQMPTRTRGGGQRQPGISESELADLEAQGNGEVGLSAKEPTQKQYGKIAAGRVEGNLPEQVVKTPVDRTQRSAVDAENIIDPVRQARVNRLAGMIQSDNTATAPGTVDSYDKMLEFLKARQQVDADADKRARRREMIAAIGDGISAISSLYQTTKGAPVTYTPGKDMSEVMRQRYDRYMAQRKADDDKYLNYLKVQHAAEQDRESQEFRRQMAEYRQQRLDDARVAKQENNELKKRELEMRERREESQRKSRDARVEYLRSLDDEKKIKNAVYYAALADAYGAGKDDEEAELYARNEQRKYNEAQQKAKANAKKSTKKKKTSRKSSSGSSGEGSLGHAPGNL